MGRVEALASGDAPVFDPRTNVTGKGVIVEGQFDYSGTTYVFKTAAQPAPSVKDSLTDAPAGSLVERVMVLLGHHGDGTARAAIREVADWLRENDSEREMGGDAAATADLIEQEADCGLLQQLNPKPPASKRLWEAMEEAGRRELEDNPHADLAEFYEAMIRAVADWFTTITPRGSEAWRMASEVLREEASR
jgi:hypothetical protein